METILTEKVYIINGKPYKQDEFEKEKQHLTEKKIVLVEVGEGQFKTRLYD
jgi:hypothetical protein